MAELEQVRGILDRHPNLNIRDPVETSLSRALEFIRVLTNPGFGKVKSA